MVFDIGIAEMEPGMKQQDGDFCIQSLSAPAAAPGRFKRRTVFSIRDYPKGCGPHALLSSPSKPEPPYQEEDPLSFSSEHNTSALAIVDSSESPSPKRRRITDTCKISVGCAGQHEIFMEGGKDEMKQQDFIESLHASLNVRPVKMEDMAAAPCKFKQPRGCSPTALLCSPEKSDKVEPESQDALEEAVPVAVGADQDQDQVSGCRDEA